eukprot:g4943.t1
MEFPCSTQSWNDTHIQALCTGIGSDLLVNVTNALGNSYPQNPGAESKLSFRPPTILNVNFGKSVSPRGETIFLYGKYFGAENFSAPMRAKFEVSNVEPNKVETALTWLSDSRVRVDFPPGADVTTVRVVIAGQESQSMEVRYSRPFIKHVRPTLSGDLIIVGDNFGDSTSMRINVIKLDVKTNSVIECSDFERESYETLRCKLGENAPPGECILKNVSVTIGKYTSNQRRVCFLGFDRVSDRAVSEGSSTKFDLRLAGEPGADSTVVALQSSSRACQMNPARVLYSSSNWTDPVQVKVVAVKNDIDEGADVTDECIINMTRSDVYQTPQTFRVTVLNDDVAGMNFEIDGRYRSRVYALTLMEGSKTSVAIALESEPRGTVNVTCKVVSPENTTLHSVVVPSGMTFNSSGWKVPRKLTVAVVEDDVDDESGIDGAVFRIECNSVSTDDEYSNIAEIAMILRALDNDERGVKTSTTFLSIIEGGEKQFHVDSLLSQPLHDVTLIFKTGEDLNISPSNISIRAEEWKNVSRAIKVRVAKGTGGGTHELVLASKSRDPNYDIENLGKINIIVNNIEGHFASVPDMTLQEGRASSFVLSLASRPKSATEIVVAALNSSSPLCQISPTQVTFSLSNWTSACSIDILAVNNFIDEGDDVQGECTISMIRAGAEEEEDAETFQVTIINDDAADVKFEIDNEYQSKLYALTLTEGSEESVKVVVESEPRAAVSMACSALSPEDTQLRVMVIPSRMTFDSSNWTVRETLTVRVMDDEIDDESGDEAVFRIECHFSSADVEYNNTATNAILLRALDNDERGIKTSASFLSIIEGGEKQFHVDSLLSQPLHDVMLILNAAHVSISPKHLFVKADQWKNISRAITVQVPEGAGGGTHEIEFKAKSFDPKYNESLGKIDVIVNTIDGVRPPLFERITTNGTHVHVTLNSTDVDCTTILEYSNSEFGGYIRLTNDGVVNQSGWNHPLYFQSRCEEPSRPMKAKAWQTAEACLHSEEYLQVYADEFRQREPLVLYSSDADEATPECKTCPSGAVCKADTIGTLASLQPQEGFVRVEQKYSKAFGMSEKCIGECSDGKCAESYAGPLCGHCAEGATVSIGRTCAQCPSHGVFVVQVLLGMVIVGAAAAYLIYDGIVGASEIESKGVLPFHTLSLRTMTSYLQVASMLSLYKMKFPGFVAGMVVGQAAVSSPGEAITNIDCMGVTDTPIELFTAKQAIIFLSPIVMCLLLGMFFSLLNFVKKRRETFVDGFIGSCLIGLNLMYPTLVKRAALVFTCREIGKAQFLDQALDIPCYEGAHIPLLACLGIPSILIYVLGFPVSLLVVLRRLTQSGALDPASDAYDRRWVVRLGFLYAGYEKKYAYWEALVLLRKASLSGFAVFLSYRSTALQVVVALLILYLCHFAQISAEPLEHDWHDLMESRSLVASLLILFACMIGDASSANDGTLPVGVSVLVASTVFLLFVHPCDIMAKGSKKGARERRHHGKFIFILMLLTVPSSTATRLHESGNRGGGGGRPSGLDEHSSNYLIDAKHAVEYGTRFTKTLVHHLEVHGVNAKHESRSGMHRLLDNVLDEMGSGVDRDDDHGVLRGEGLHMNNLRQGDGEGVSRNQGDGQWKTSVNHETEREVQSERRRNPEAHSSNGTAAADINGPSIDHFGLVPRESLMHIRGDSFETCWRAQSLLKDLANATNVGIKEGPAFMAQVESHVEQFTPCQTATSSCLVRAVRNDSIAGAHECAPVAELREGTCAQVRELQERVEEVIERYHGLGIIDNVRTLLGKVREDCKAVVPHGRRLAECPTIPTSGY